MKKILLLILYYNVLVFSQSASPLWITYFEKSGFTSTPDYNETMAYFQMLADSSEFAELKTFGISPQGRELKYLIINKNKYFEAGKVKKSSQPVVLLINGIHSGEIEGKDASMLLLREILITGEKRNLVNNLTFLVVPIFSVDGHERRSRYNRINQNGPEEMGWRVTSQNLNLNRDWMKADAPEVQAMLKLTNKWDPDFVIDSHTTDGADYQYTLTYSVEKYGNIYKKTGEWLKDEFIPYFEKGVESAGYLCSPYIYLKNWRVGLDDGIIDWAATPRFSTGYFALRNRPSLLIETHMIKPYKERVYSTKAAIETVLGYVGENSETLYNLNREADYESINYYIRKENYLPVNFDITDKYSIMNFKGYKYSRENSDVSGGKKLVYTHDATEFKVKYYNDVIPIDSVKLPKAYIVPREWSDVIGRLKLHGIEMDTFKKDTSLMVTVYRFNDVEFDSLPYEGRQRVNLEYNEEKKLVNVSEGDILISTSQPLLRVIAGLLEPKSGDSFVRWGYFNAIFEQKEYFDNYVMEKIGADMLKNDPELKKEFDEKLKDDKFKNDPYARLNFLYKKSPYWDDRLNLYPVLKLE